MIAARLILAGLLLGDLSAAAQCLCPCPDAGVTDAGFPDAGEPDAGAGADSGVPVAIVGVSRTIQAPISVGSPTTETRDYIAAVDPRCAGLACPLVLALGGIGWRGEALRASDPRIEANASQPAVYLYPTPLPGCGSLCWDLSSGGRDVALLDALRAFAGATWGTDPARVYVVGRSYGGALATEYVAARPGVVARLATTIQWLQGSVAAQPMPVSIWAASGDPSVGQAPATARDMWRAINGCAPTTPIAVPTTYGAVADQSFACSSPVEWHIQFSNSHAPPAASGAGIAAFLGLR